MTSESNAMVDKRIMAKLLVTYFERNGSKDVLTLMARMLVRGVGFSQGFAGRNVQRHGTHGHGPHPSGFGVHTLHPHIRLYRYVSAYIDMYVYVKQG